MPSSPSSFTRHALAPHRTTVKLEAEFWAEIDRLAARAGLSWQQWTEKELAARPAVSNAASWLRIRCLIHSTKGA